MESLWNIFDVKLCNLFLYAVEEVESLVSTLHKVAVAWNTSTRYFTSIAFSPNWELDAYGAVKSICCLKI